jgi:hypothetical protein
MTTLLPNQFERRNNQKYDVAAAASHPQYWAFRHSAPEQRVVGLSATER